MMRLKWLMWDVFTEMLHAKADYMSLIVISDYIAKGASYRLEISDTETREILLQITKALGYESCTCSDNKSCRITA